jgi:predicted nuclease of predicted toxin-antitoxin system
MKLLLDENLSPKLIPQILVAYPGSLYIANCGFRKSLDLDVWNIARIHGFALVSKDSDFYNYSILMGHPPKAIWLRVGNCTTASIVDLLLAAKERMEEFDQDPIESCLVLPINGSKRA